MPNPTITTFTENYTPPFPFLNVQDDPQLTLELKPYIQPFERVLAKAELIGLLGIKTSLKTETKPYMTLFSDTLPVKTLQRRLAYWQRIGYNELEPTLQVCYESTVYLDNGMSDAGVIDLPTSRRLRYGPHGIHEYRGKFFPQLVKSLINFAGISEGATVLDPMCGSGTTICEARTMGMKAIGVDINPLAIEISKCKADLLVLTPEQLRMEYEELIHTLKHAKTPEFEKFWNKHDIEYLLRWFDSKALNEIATIRRVLSSNNTSNIKALAEMVLSNILRAVSWQKNNSLRTHKKITTYIEGTTILTFVEEVKRQFEKLAPYLSLLQKAKHLPQHEVISGDARNLNSVLPTYIGKCDLLITSPPYATALPYIDTDRLSLIVLGLLPRQDHRSLEFQLIGNREVTVGQHKKLWETYQTRKNELPNDVCQLIDRLARSNHNDKVGFRRRNLPALLAKYFLDMIDFFHSAHEMMKPGSYAFIVVGNNSTTVEGNQRLNIPTNEFLWQIGKQVGWKGEQMIDMELMPSRDVFRKNSGSKETILVFKHAKKTNRKSNLQ